MSRRPHVLFIVPIISIHHSCPAAVGCIGSGVPVEREQMGSWIVLVYVFSQLIGQCYEFSNLEIDT